MSWFLLLYCVSLFTWKKSRHYSAHVCPSVRLSVCLSVFVRTITDERKEIAYQKGGFSWSAHRVLGLGEIWCWSEKIFLPWPTWHDHVWALSYLHIWNKFCMYVYYITIIFMFKHICYLTSTIQHCNCQICLKFIFLHNIEFFMLNICFFYIFNCLEQNLLLFIFSWKFALNLTLPNLFLIYIY